MAKSQEHIKARLLRKKGYSIKEIAHLLRVSKSSASIWCRDIELTVSQIEKLHEQMILGSYAGRLKGARLQKERKEARIKFLRNAGIKNINIISRRELLFAGLGLYLGEGTKLGSKFQFSNSSPQIARLFVLWLEKCLGVKRRDLVCAVFINNIHASRENIVKKFWMKTLKLAPDQFRKTTFIKVKNKKVYENFNNYYGTLAIRAKKSSDLQYRILGLCYGVLVNSGVNMPA